jgi:hypothetical protein
MQKIVQILSIAIIAAVFLTSCGSSRSTMNTQNAQISTLKREEYILLNNDVNVEITNKGFWFLFIKFAGQSEARLRERIYTKAVQSVPQAQGILNPRYDVKGRVIPLIVVTFTKRTVKLRGQAFRMKTDAELELDKTKAAKAAKN